MVERPLWEREVAGSNPVTPTSILLQHRARQGPLSRGSFSLAHAPRIDDSHVRHVTRICGVVIFLLSARWRD
ncbi:hypothetical protein PSCLAVI8L_390013 [Pseudoclavibacter sp. 8L]|nr:hypothetical protein PSCLAVI8L_390013 [Pseudoclavibacter sp. 8L]